VPMHDGSIDDDLRIRASVPTLQYLLDHNCKVVIISHLGRPEGRDPKFSLAPIARRLGELLGQNVNFVDDCIGDGVYQAVKNVPMKSVTLLENLRYYKEEEADDEEFAKKLAHDSMAAYFVQDGFGVVHRAHASTHAITLCLPSVSGAMANTFLKTYKGIPIGKSLVEDGQASTLAQIYDAAKAKVGADNVDEFIQLPIDLGVATEIDENAERRNVFVNHINENDIALDIGDASIDKVVKTVASAGTVIWNGTLGYAELPAFAHGSARLALSLATQKQTTSIIGGGDTADFVLKWDAEGGKSFTHVSTGGGASLELMAGDKLPGIESLLNAYK
jgi:phosphoglycerate kinase